MQLSLREFTRADFPTLEVWRRDRAMQQWWGPPVTVDQLEDDYGDTIDGRFTDEDGPANLFVVELDGEPIGFAENYLIDDHAAYAAVLGVRDAVGIDYAICVPSHRGKGLGRQLVALLIDDAFDRHPTADKVRVAPKAANIASCGACRSVGLELVEQRHIPGEWPEEGDSAVYGLDRVSWEARFSVG